jgi:hypothetical protein
MSNPIVYSPQALTNALNKGYFYIGTNDVGKGPTSSTGYFDGVTPSNNQYVIYYYKDGSTKIYYCSNGDQVYVITNRLKSQNFTTLESALNYIATQGDMMCVNREYEPIVTNGLVLNLDAGFVPSYPMTGSTWYDLSDNDNDGTLTNGPTFNSGNGGSIVFDGVNDYITLSSSLESLTGTTEASLNMWLKLNSGSNSSGRSGLINLTSQNTTNGNLYYYKNTGNVGGIWLNIFRTNRVYTGDWQPTVDGTLWHNLTITTTPGVNGWKMYLNGILRYQTTGQNTVNINSSIIGGIRLGQNSGSRDLWGNISLTSIYNRALTPTEVLQNYNAQKGRFGL